MVFPVFSYLFTGLPVVPLFFYCFFYLFVYFLSIGFCRFFLYYFLFLFGCRVSYFIIICFLVSISVQLCSSFIIHIRLQLRGVGSCTIFIGRFRHNRCLGPCLAWVGCAEHSWRSNCKLKLLGWGFTGGTHFFHGVRRRHLFADVGAGGSFVPLGQRYPDGQNDIPVNNPHRTQQFSIKYNILLRYFSFLFSLEVLLLVFFCRCWNLFFLFCFVCLFVSLFLYFLFFRVFNNKHRVPPNSQILQKIFQDFSHLSAPITM